MRQIILTSLTATVLISFASNASAVVINSMVGRAESVSHRIKQGYRVNRDWPYPYFCPDRAAARAPFDLMVNNGWRRQNLLGAHHFDPDGVALTTAGELKVRWIMTQAPPNHREIFVERADDPTVTANRVASARDFAVIVALNEEAPQVAETHIVSEGRPASTVDATNVKFQDGTTLYQNQYVPVDSGTTLP